MRSKLGYIWALLAMLALGQTSLAQNYQPMPGGAYPPGGYPGGGVYDQGGFAPMSGDLQVKMPGRVWFESNVADRGLGYRGSYLTLGAKTHLFEDWFDGRWAVEAQGHYALESQGFFGNLGLQRAFSINAAGADFVLGGWVDYDGDQQGTFAHDFTQLAVNAAIKTRKWDLVGNGYFPMATTDYSQGDPTGVNCFLNNNIVLLPGIDSALKGFDATLRTRPEALGMVNGTVDFGGYGYSSELIEFFGGGRARVGMQVLNGLMINAEVNYDDRFNTTGVLQVAYIFGANARGTEFSGLGRDLDPTMRNDHIVRFQQDLVLAIDPDTGRPYNVLHVDNTADPAFSNGAVRTPFRSLLDAELASANDDIIFVREGDGTTNFYNMGITLKDGQLFLGDGVEHLIPIQDGRFFRLCNDLDGNRPRITNNANGAAVTLADRNTVRGFIMDGSNNSMAYGIYGNGAMLGGPVNGGIIEDNLIFGAILHGVYTNDTIGNWTYSRNVVRNNGFDGIFMENACDPTSVFRYEDNFVNNNGRHGIHMRNYDAASLTFLRNTTNGNLGDGVRLDTFKAGAGQRASIRFAGHTANGNTGNGINIINGDGDLRFLNSQIVNNLGGGIRIQDWTNTDARDLTLIGTTTGGDSNINNNGGVGIDVILNAGRQNLQVSDSTVNGNGAGIRAIARNVGTTLNTNILDNRSISNNFGDGINLNVVLGALHNVVIDNPTSLTNPSLPILNNGLVAGNGIRMLVGDASGVTSTMNALIQRTNIQNSGGDGISADVTGLGNLQLMVRNSSSSGNAGDGIRMNIDNSAAGTVNSILLDNSNFLNNADNAVQLVTGTDTFTDLLVNNVVMTNTLVQGVDGNGNAFTAGGTNGFVVTAAGNNGILSPQVDNRTRVIMAGSVISNFVNNGFVLNTTGDAHAYVQLVSNQIFTNGSGLDGATLPFFNGINMTAGNDSVINARLTNNLVTDNFELGINMATIAGAVGEKATINAVLTDNNFADNDRGEDTTNNPIIDSNINDARFANSATGLMCLAMSNNVFLFNTNFVNAAAPADFRIELDGLTNGFGSGAIGPGFTFPIFGTACDGLVTAEELAFIADGFPPN